MDTLPERVARALLLGTGLLSLYAIGDTQLPEGAARVALLHQLFLSALLAAALVSAALLRPLRWPVLAAALLSKAGLVAIALLTPGVAATPSLYLDMLGLAALLCAGVLLRHAGRQQARWDGLVRTRQEA